MSGVPVFDETARALMDAALDAVVVIDGQGLVIGWSKNAETVFGWRRDEAMGRPVAELIIPERYRAAHAAGLEHFRVTGEGRVVGQRLEIEALRRDGSEFPVELSITRVGTPGGFVASAYLRDITDRKAADRLRVDLAVERERSAVATDLARLNLELEEANRELEAFSHAVAHDLRSPLRAMSGFSQALLRDQAGGLGEDAARHLRYVAESAREMGRLIDDLLALSRLTRTEVKRERVDLSQVARAAVEELRRASPERRVEVTIEDGLVANGDPRMLAAAVEELLGNAWKFTRDCADPRIEFAALPAESPRTFLVRDNGAGFDMAYAGKLFGVFTRLHPPGEFEGTGVGLASVQRIVRRHGGRIWAEGEPDRGSTFYFTLDAPPAGG